MSEEWGPAETAARLAEADRVVVLFYADWCPFSQAFLEEFEEADAESSVPCARVNLHHPLDPRWDEHRVLVVPTLAYFEKGEELERADGIRGHGLSRADLDGFMEHVEALQESRTGARPRRWRSRMRR